MHAGFDTFDPALDGASSDDQRAPLFCEALTARERQVLDAMVGGLSDQQMADEIVVSLPTVKFHISNILSNLHVGSRTQAVLLALRHKLVEPP